jgi:hypothetical protein
VIAISGISDSNQDKRAVHREAGTTSFMATPHCGHEMVSVRDLPTRGNVSGFGVS